MSENYYPGKSYKNVFEKINSIAPNPTIVQMTELIQLIENEFYGVMPMAEHNKHKARELMWIAWKAGYNSCRMYPDQKHTFIDFWDREGESTLNESILNFHLMK